MTTYVNDFAMTLAEWRVKYPDVMIREWLDEEKGWNYVWVKWPESGQARWDLFHLSDYVVSSTVSGPAYHLVKRWRI